MIHEEATDSALTTSHSHLPLFTITLKKAMDQFKKDASVLLKPFGNRIPNGVKGLDAILTEYVSFKDADTKRSKAVANNPLARRMYETLEENVVGVTPAAHEPEPGGGLGGWEREHGDGTGDVAGVSADGHVCGRPIPPVSPSNAGAMPPPLPRSPSGARGKKRGGAVPRRNVDGGEVGVGNARDGTTTGAGLHGDATDKDNASHDGATRNKTQSFPPGSLDDQAYERLAAIIVNHVPGGNVVGNLGGIKDTLNRSILADVNGGDPDRDSWLDVDAVMESLFENDNDGSLGDLLGPLLGGAFGGRKRNTPDQPSAPLEKTQPSPKKSKRRLEMRNDAGGGDDGNDERAPGAGTHTPKHLNSLDLDAFVRSIEYGK